MESLREIIAKRSSPGVLVLDLEDRLLFSNEMALEVLGALQADAERPLPGEVYALTGELRRRPRGTVSGVLGPRGEGEPHYSLRAFLLGQHRGEGAPGYVMVLMEKLIRNRQLDLEQARRRFQLSKRETEVVQLISRGLANKEISDAIFISEFTVKDHIKNIMRKMGAGSRNEIVAALL